MLETHAGKFEHLDPIDHHRGIGLRLAWCFQDGVKIVQRHFGLAVDIDDISQFLKRTKNEE